MANPNKAKKYEVGVCRCQVPSVEDFQFGAWRRLELFDEGDLGGLPQWAFECRDRAKIDLSKNVKDANDRARAKGALYGVTVIKKRNGPVESAYVAMDLETFAKLLERIERKDNE